MFSREPEASAGRKFPRIAFELAETLGVPLIDGERMTGWQLRMDKELRFLAKWAQEESATRCWGLPAHQLQVQHALRSIEIIKRIRTRLDEANISDGELAGLYDGQPLEWPWVGEISSLCR